MPLFLIVQAGPIFTLEDDPVSDTSEIISKQNPELAIEIPDLLSVNQLLESVSFFCMYFS